MCPVAKERFGPVYPLGQDNIKTMSHLSKSGNRTYERFTPENTTFLLVDYNIGFSIVANSQSVTENMRSAKAVLKMAMGYNAGLIFNLGVGQTPFPVLAEVLGDRPILWRGAELNAFDSPSVVEAVEKLGRSHLVLAGLTTEGCVGHTAMSAIRKGYTVAIVVDATAGESREAHEIALQRLIQAGVIPYTWGSLLNEFQGSWQNEKSAQTYFNILGEASPEQSYYFTMVAKAQAADSAKQHENPSRNDPK